MIPQKVVEDLRSKATSYRPNEKILNEIRQKNLLCAMGPASIGKSTILDLVAEVDSDFGRTGSLVTRKPEARDNPKLNHYVSRSEAIDLIKKQELVNYIVHPTTQHIYGSEVAMYSHTFNMLETLPGAINYFRNLGFKTMQILYFVTEPHQWQVQFNERYPKASSERTKRLDEAKLNLAWALSPKAADVKFIYNAASKKAETAQKIINLVKYNQQAENGQAYAKGMLARIEEMR